MTPAPDTGWSPYAGTAPVAALDHHAGRVTLVEGQTFCLSGRTGDVLGDLPHGLFVLDRRALCVWELWLNDHRLEPLAVHEDDPFSASFVGRGRPTAGHADADLVIHRRRRIGNGLREEVVVDNHGLAAATADLRLRCWNDFADVFAVKESRVVAPGAAGRSASRSRWSWEAARSSCGSAAVATTRRRCPSSG